MISAELPAVGRLRTAVRVWVDALTYAVALTAVSAVVALTLGVATGGEFVRGKRILFVLGWVMMAYATAKLWVKSGKQLRGASTRTQGGEADQHDQDDTPEDRMSAAAFRSSAASDTTRNVYGESLRGRQDATRFQSLVQSLPPNRWVLPPRPERRVGVTGKVLLASVLVLGLSFVMETVFGVV